MGKEIRVTTVDNPYDPFDEWEKWLLFDTNKGYHTCERLASITVITDLFTDDEIYDAVEDGIEELMKTGALNKLGEIVEFKKVIKESSVLKQSEESNEDNELTSEEDLKSELNQQKQES